MKVLAGDIGGTKTALAVIEIDGGRLDVQSLETFPSANFDALEEIVSQFIETWHPACDYASFGIAGPVHGGICVTTNLPWRVDAGQLATALGLQQAWLLNDLEANAWGISTLDDADFLVLNEGAPHASGNAAIISAGTGLGQAGLFRDGSRHRPFASEGGHADFAPGTELEIALLRYLLQQYDHVSWERVVSGMGLVNIHAFLTDFRRMPVPDWLREQLLSGDAAAAISSAALARRCPVCSEALDLFVHLYGVEAGNQALKLMATGGVYIGGGIAPRIIDKLREPDFLYGFQSKGRMESLMRSMPVRVILNPLTALRGAAVYAEMLLK